MSQIVMIRRMMLILAALLIICCRMPNTCADPFPVVWETGVGGNGHAYLLVEEDSTTFAKALSGASSYHWTGAGKGYLATITGADEQAFIYDYIRSTISNVSSIMYWFIGSQKTSPNATNWFWINGPEEGIVFYAQTFRNLTYHCCCLTYCAWGYRPGLGPEPNGEGGIEDSLSLILNDASYNTSLPWNDDAHDFLEQGYLVEFGGFSGNESLSITNLSLPDFGVEFPTASPTHRVSPSLSASQSVVEFAFVTISELDDSATVVRSLAIEQLNFLGHLEDNNTLVSFSSRLGFGNATTSSLVFTFVRTSSSGENETSSLGEEFSGQVLQWSLKIQGWPFIQTTNFLRLDINISLSSSGDQMLLFTPLSNGGGGGKLLTVQDGDGFFVFLGLLDALTIDGNVTTMMMMMEPMLVGNQLQIFLPSFQRELFLDPTLAILVLQSKGGGDDDPLIIGLTAGLVGGLLVVIAIGGLVAAGVVVGLNFWRRRGIVGKAINWDQGDTTAAL